MDTLPPQPLRQPSRRFTYVLGAMIMAGGAPIGLLVVRAMTRPGPTGASWVLDEVSSDPALYLYLVLATSVVLSAVGFLLGRYEDRLSRLSSTDSLTGLMNRRRFNVLVGIEVHRALRYQSPLSLLIIDVDNFKRVNDAYGHAAGDAGLCLVAENLNRTCRRTDVACRYGGDEFAALLPGTEAEDARIFAERLSKNVSSAPAYVPGAQPLSLSIGVAQLHASDSSEARNLLARADQAMYLAKQGGRSRSVVAEPEDVAHD